MQQSPPQRLLTYAAAAKRMGISTKAFRERVARGTIPDDLLWARERTGHKRELFVDHDKFTSWCGGTIVTEPKETGS